MFKTLQSGEHEVLCIGMLLRRGAELLTMAKPDSRAEVRLVALSFARLR